MKQKGASKSNRGKNVRRNGRDRRNQTEFYDQSPVMPQSEEDEDEDETSEDDERETSRRGKPNHRTSTNSHHSHDPTGPTLASQSNKFLLYQDAVQAPRKEIVTLHNLHHELFFSSSTPSSERHPPLTLREDFCGTAVLCREWVARNSAERSAWGVDNDPVVLAYAREHVLADDPSVAERVALVEGDVLVVEGMVPRVDVIAGLNYGVFYFHKRCDLVAYLRKARGGLNDQGILVIDAFGGAKTQVGNKKKRRGNGYTGPPLIPNFSF
ncbi:hypothetical protein BC936DRAFT_139054 [Jimgerdemannia flammicorona]|uniref:Methyltransferase domain-containing protein n=1 Tax=Jimgerdemannia flammicorona TaxID=994334 RepID=A0A433DHW2_9FUNG|nr:hypothetical protein BC936DRAFT_139054 [Jimgerdemannia flammicorona]